MAQLHTFSFKSHNNVGSQPESLQLCKVIWFVPFAGVNYTAVAHLQIYKPWCNFNARPPANCSSRANVFIFRQEDNLVREISHSAAQPRRYTHTPQQTGTQGDFSTQSSRLYRLWLWENYVVKCAFLCSLGCCTMSSFSGGAKLLLWPELASHHHPRRAGAQQEPDTRWKDTLSSERQESRQNRRTATTTKRSTWHLTLACFVW